MNRKQRRSGKKRKGGKAPKAILKMSLERIVQEAEAAVDEMDGLKAATFFETAANVLRAKVKQDRKRMDELITILSKLGETKASNGDPLGARDCFVEAANQLEANPDVTTILPITQIATLYLYLGQLSEEEEALLAYQKGVEHLEASLENVDLKVPTDSRSGVSVDSLRRQLAGAFCSIAELYMTDLCYAEGAEEACQSAINRALDIRINGKPTADALQALASLRLSQSRATEAPEHILAAYEHMRPGCEALSSLVGLTDPGPTTSRSRRSIELNIKAADSLPDFGFRRQTARILIECAALPGTEDCAQAAICVLGSMFAEDDEDTDIWYLMGCAHMALQPPEEEAATFYWEKTRCLLRKTKESHLEGDRVEAADALDLDRKIGEVESKLLLIKRETADDNRMDDT